MKLGLTLCSYEVPIKRFTEAVKRNFAKFPEDFMFVLTDDEFAALRSQSATSNAGRGGRRYVPRVFTEHGALMVATIVSSPRAIEIAVYVMRAFVHLRELVGGHRELAKRLDGLEQKTQALAFKHDTFRRNTRLQLTQVLDALRDRMTMPDPPKRPIGFVVHEDKKNRSKR